MPVIRIAFWILILVSATLLPFLPGRHDPLATPFAVAAAVASFGGLLLVPIGVVWLFVGRAYAAARIAVGVVALIVFAASAAMATGTLIAGAAILAVGVTRLVHLWRAVSAAQARPAPLPRAVPVGLIVIPLMTTAAILALLEPLATWSRDQAMRNAAEFITAVERFRARTGAYPVALNSLWPDYHPGIIGIDRYRYEPSGDAYNLYFEHPATSLGAREIVMYNPKGEQDFSSHVLDLLEFSPEQIRRARGHFASERLPAPGWKRFRFD